ncbi:MAG: heavy metal translocating P-type ATPase, partial [Oscillospiraceae bacterium]
MSRKQRKMLYRIIAAAVVWTAGFLLKHIFNTEERFGIQGIILLVIFTASYIIIGWDVLWKAVRNIAHGQVFDENFLMSIASIGA